MSIGKGSYFRRYWIGEALSNLGTRTASIAYPLLALALTHSPARAGLVGFAGGLLVEAVGGPASFVCLAVFDAAIAGGTLAPSLATLERRVSAATEST